MGNSTSVSQREREKYTEAVVEWERVCAAMEAEEARSHARNRMGTCSLAGYCVIQTVEQPVSSRHVFDVSLLGLPNSDLFLSNLIRVGLGYATRNGIRGVKGLLVEVPLRVAWHGSCFTAQACCCVPPCALLTAAQRTMAERNNNNNNNNTDNRSSNNNNDDGDDDGVDEESIKGRASSTTAERNDALQTGAAIAAQATAWHAEEVVSYVEFAQFLAHNITNPCTPYNVFESEVSLSRPPKPTKPSRPITLEDCCAGGCLSNCFSCDNCCHCCANNLCSCEVDRLQALTNRFIRSRLCVFMAWNGGRECQDSLHLATCLGPWPCLGEHQSQRLIRWNDDFQRNKDARTETFWRVYRDQPERYSFCRSDSGRVVASVVEEVDLGSDCQNACVRTALSAVVCGSAAAACTWAMVPLFPASAPCGAAAATLAGGAVNVRTATAAAVGVATAAATVGIATIPRGTSGGSSSSNCSSNGRYGEVLSSGRTRQDAEVFTVELGNVSGPARGHMNAPEAFAIVRPQPDGDTPAHGVSYGAISK